MTQILIGNKSDMVAERQVDTSEGKQLADQYNIPFLETSAKDNVNISDIFQKLGVGIKERLLKEEHEDQKNSTQVRQIHNTPQQAQKVSTLSPSF